MNIINKLKIKIKEHQYIRYIDKHIENVEKAFYELALCPYLNHIMNEYTCAKLYDQIKVHDESKYEVEEFDAYRKNFYPINKQEKEDNKKDFDKAWEHHLKNNRHHWQSRQYDKEFTMQIQIDILENVCDWLAMGYTFGDRPYQYYEKNKDKINLPKKDREFLEKIIYEGIDKDYVK